MREESNEESGGDVKDQSNTDSNGEEDKTGGIDELPDADAVKESVEDEVAVEYIQAEEYDDDYEETLPSVKNTMGRKAILKRSLG